MGGRQYSGGDHDSLDGVKMGIIGGKIWRGESSGRVCCLEMRNYGRKIMCGGGWYLLNGGQELLG